MAPPRQLAEPRPPWPRWRKTKEGDLMGRALNTLLDGLAFPEGPRWRDGRLWFSDMHGYEVVAMTPDGARETVYAAKGPVSGLGSPPGSATTWWWMRRAARTSATLASAIRTSARSSRPSSRGSIRMGASAWR